MLPKNNFKNFKKNHNFQCKQITWITAILVILYSDVSILIPTNKDLYSTYFITIFCEQSYTVVSAFDVPSE